MNGFRKGLILLAPLLFMLLSSTRCDAQGSAAPMSELEFKMTLSRYKDTLIESMFRLDSIKELEIGMQIRQNEAVRKENKRLRIKNMVMVLAVAVCIVVISIIQ